MKNKINLALQTCWIITTLSLVPCGYALSQKSETIEKTGRSVRRLQQISLLTDVNTPVETEIMLPRRTRDAHVMLTGSSAYFTLDNTIHHENRKALLRVGFQSDTEGVTVDTLHVFFGNQRNNPLTFVLTARCESAQYLYPNPVHTTLIIPGRGDENTMMKISNESGDQMFQGVYQSTLDVSRWPAGMYVLTLQTKNGMKRSKFLKK